MIKCSEIYNPDLLFEFDAKSPLVKLSLLLHTEGDPAPYEWVNEDLLNMFNHNVTNDGTGDDLSLDYLLNRQDKYFSPLFERLLTYYGTDYTSLTARLIGIIVTKFLKGWSKLADAFFADYNPIQNYDMTEHEENGGTNKQSTNLTESTTSNETIINKYNGFNTVDSAKVSESSNNGSGSKTTSGTQATNETAIDNERELTRSGNIGVTTSQQMIESEYNLRKKNLLNIIYNDIDSVLFTDIY